MALSLLERLLVPIAAREARRAYEKFVDATSDCGAAQERQLSDWLSRHAGSAFGRDHGLDQARDYSDFARRVQPAGYDAFRPYVDRLRRGDLRALLGPRQRLLMFALTSGTTNLPKYVPVTGEFLRDYQRGWRVWGVKAILDHERTFSRGIVQITSPMRDHDTETGVPCGAITGLLAARQQFLVRRFYVAPLCVADIPDSTAKYYTLMRLAIPRDVAFLVTANPATLLLLARTADAHREQLIRDIHDGTLTQSLPVPPAVRAALRSRLAPLPEVARRLERLVSSTGALRPRDYWTLSFLAHWTGGTMGLYRRMFPDWYGDVPVRDIGLLASEGRMSVPIEDNTPSGVLDVTKQFFEFIPADAYEDERRPVLRCHEVREGEEYFLLLTNSTGLCRYDIGDRVRVTGRFGDTPMVEFLSKGAHTASMAGEKLTENQVVTAMQRAAERLARPIDTFVLSPQFGETPCYRLYVERPGAAESAQSATARLANLAADLDTALSELNVEYAGKRESQRLGPIEVGLLPGGYLSARDAQLRAARGGRAEQFKHQYLLPRPGMDADWPAVLPRPEIVPT